MSKLENFIRRLTFRHQEPISLYRCIKGGFKGMVTILLLSLFTKHGGVKLLMAPFGASCILIYTTPQDEFAQPINIVGGYFIAGLVSLTLVEILPHDWWTVSLMLWFTITLMAIFRVTHPPAGAVPIVIYFARMTMSFWYLAFPILIGSILLVGIALLVHRIPPPRTYPRLLSDDSETSER